jgi:hypothetical protein
MEKIPFAALAAIIAITISRKPSGYYHKLLSVMERI